LLVIIRRKILTKEFKTKEIKGIKCVSEKLKAARKRLRLSLEDAEIDTKIRYKYLEALEKNQFSLLPSEVHALGFLRRYADYLSLNSADLIMQYKTEWKAAMAKDDRKQDFSPSSNIPQLELAVTPRSVLIIIVFLFIISFFGYIWWAVKKFNAPPKLEITKPISQEVIDDDKLIIKGSTDPGSFVLINNEAVNVAPGGAFTQEVSLVEGMNTIEILAKNRLNKQTKHLIKIIPE
jgi:cytoskeletal protein RodZ